MLYYPTSPRVMIRLIVIIIVVILWSMSIIVKSVVVIFATTSSFMIVFTRILLELITVGGIMCVLLLTITKVLLPSATHKVLRGTWLEQTNPFLSQSLLCWILQGVFYRFENWLHTGLVFSQYENQFLNDIKSKMILNESLHDFIVTQPIHEALYSFKLWFLQDPFYNIRWKFLNRELQQVRL